MGISGSLHDFSLPEILQIIDNGSKSGRLSITAQAKTHPTIASSGMSNLWFKYGNFVAFSDPINYKYLIGLIRKENLICAKNLVKLHTIGQENTKTLGEYCLQSELLNFEQINSLFEKQLAIVYSLFELDHGSFVFEDINLNQKLSNHPETFPLSEMTGQKCPALTISLNGMRSLKKLNTRLAEQIPDPSLGFIKLTENPNCKLLPIEAAIWDAANAKSSLKKIAKLTLFDIKELQEAALRLILVGLIEAVPVIEVSTPLPLTYAPSSFSQKPVVSAGNNLVSNQQKTQVSNSFLGNLVSFLRNNF